jgi:hypothetical protein
MRTLDESEANDWTYLAEGNANLVFRYCGSDSSLDRKVLRVRKHSQATDVKKLLEFQKKLVTILFGDEYCVSSVYLFHLGNCDCHSALLEHFG